MREPSLWPVLLVLIGYAAAFVAPMLLLGLRDGRPGAMAVLLAVALLTAASVRFDFRRAAAVPPR